MKATGIVRRIDDLGRVVVPKEIRRTLRIREGDPLEIFTDRDGAIVLRKYSPIGELADYAKDFAYAIERSTAKTAMICDKDSIISVSGEYRKDYVGKALSRQMENIIEGRTPVFNDADNGGCAPVFDGEDASAISAQIVVPILSEGQTIGAVTILTKNNEHLSTCEQTAAKVAASFLGAQMEQ